MTRRVYMSMLIETDQAPENVQLVVLASLSDKYKILSTNVTRSDDIELSPQITFVICPVRGLLRVYVDDDDDATMYAKEEGAVTLNWSADADYRGEVTA